MQDSLSLGRIAGVKVGINWSLFAFAALVAYFLATSRLPADVPGYSSPAYWLAGSVTAVVLLLGVLVHEGAHAVAARKADLHVDGITLWFMGGLTRIEGDAQNPMGEFVIALVGPLASALVGGVSLGLAAGASAAGWHLAAESLAWLGVINLALAVLNLLPASPLDGGRVLHGLLWWATGNRWLSTRLMAWAGTGLGGLAVFVGLFEFDNRDSLDGIMLMITGWFVLSAAKREQLAGRAQYVLGGVHISDIMRPAVIAPGWLTASAFWNEWVTRYPDAGFLLERWGDDSWSGAVTAQQLAAVPPGMQNSVRAQDVALSLPPSRLSASASNSAPGSLGGAPALTPSQPALAIAGRGGGALPVEENGRVVGVVIAPDIAAMVARGTPVPRRTWASMVWPASAPPSSRYA
ncbi:MAG TPA: site-2 protease family protein [Acidimicrobiales bacterium]|nr:site-2 protease family protein [Acidimicrobiales bacterium]